MNENVFEQRFLPMPEEELQTYFAVVEGDSTADHLAAWRRRIERAATKEADFLDRDETLWTAGALTAVHRSQDQRGRWKKVLVAAFGTDGPLGSWDTCLDGDLRLYLEVGLPSPPSYTEWLREHLEERHPLHRRVALGKSSSRALEGRTHLDAMLVNPANGFAVHIESKVLSDMSASTTFDAQRNQLARNLDCMLQDARAGTQHVDQRRPDRSLFVLLTPGMFRDAPHSRLYGQTLREYQHDAAAIHRDLPHRSLQECESLRSRIGWLTFEDVAATVPGSCAWLKAELD